MPFDDLPEPPFTGTKDVEPELDDAARLHRLAVLLPRVGAEGQVPGDPRAAGGAELYDDAQELLDEIVAGELLQARGVYGYWPARADGDDIVARGRRRASASCASSPRTATRGRTAASPTTSRRPATTSARSPSPIHGADELVGALRGRARRLQAIMVKALADRLAEAFAEYLHQQVRARVVRAGRAALAEELLAERFRGIRPAFGYPGVPGSHREAQALRAPRTPSAPGSS